jgi:hypothetical protein
LKASETFSPKHLRRGICVVQKYKTPFDRFLPCRKKKRRRILHDRRQSNFEKEIQDIPHANLMRETPLDALFKLQQAKSEPVPLFLSLSLILLHQKIVTGQTKIEHDFSK